MDALQQPEGLPGCHSAKLHKTIWLTGHVQGQNQLIPPQPQRLGRASTSKGKQTYFPYWSQQQYCLCAHGEMGIKEGPRIRNASLLQRLHKGELCLYASEGVW